MSSTRRSSSKRPVEAIPPRSSEGYFKTPNGMFDWQLPTTFRPTQRLVYLCLNRHANNRAGRLVMGISQTRIAAETGLGKTTVERAVAFLKKVGLLTVKRRGGTRRGDKRLTSVYRVAEVDDFSREELCDAITRRHVRGRHSEKSAA